jgi:glycosyltransferase involved in cell wall biosynthesis
MKRLALGYSAIACLSERQHSFYRRLGIPVDKLSLVDSYFPPHAVSVDESEHPLKEVLDWIESGSGKVIVASGYAKSYYNHDWVIDALENDPALQSARYLLCCYGPKTELLEELRQRLETSGNGRLVYGLTPAQFDHVLGKCDIYSRPTSVDSFGIALWDAAAKGLVVVASDVCARPPQALLHRTGDKEAFKSLLSEAQRPSSNHDLDIKNGTDRIELQKFLEAESTVSGNRAAHIPKQSSVVADSPKSNS